MNKLSINVTLSLDSSRPSRRFHKRLTTVNANPKCKPDVEQAVTL
jgi:hypothetical protein